MQELLEWLDRMRALAEARDSSIGERFRKIATATTLDFDDRIARVVATGAQVYPFGGFPSSLSVLAWPEPADRPESFSDTQLAAQLGAMLVLATDRLVRVSAAEALLGIQGTSKRLALPTGVSDRSLYGPLPDDTADRFERHLASLLGCDAPDAKPIGDAIELHYTATLLIELDPNAAYALGVAGIERLATSFGSSPPEWTHWEDSKRLDAVFDEIGLSEPQQARLRSELLEGRHLRLRQTLASYVTESLRPDFWEVTVNDYVPKIDLAADGNSTFDGFTLGEERPISKFVPNTSDELRRRLLASYDRRSAYVHTGARPAGVSDLYPLIDRENRRTEPLSFVAIRCILRWLILRELDERSSPAELPGVRARTTTRP